MFCPKWSWKLILAGLFVFSVAFIVTACGTFVSASDAEGAKLKYDATRAKMVDSLTVAQQKLSDDMVIAATQPKGSPAAIQVEADKIIVQVRKDALAGYDTLGPIVNNTYGAATNPSPENVAAAGATIGGAVSVINPGIGGGIIAVSSVAAGIMGLLKSFKSEKKATDTKAAMSQAASGVATGLKSLGLTTEQVDKVIAIINAAVPAGNADANKFMDTVTTENGRPNLAE